MIERNNIVMKKIFIKKFETVEFEKFVEELFLLDNFEHHKELSVKNILNSNEFLLISRFTFCILESEPANTLNYSRLGVIGLLLLLFIEQNLKENVYYLSESLTPISINDRIVIPGLIKFRDGSIQLSFSHIEQVSDKETSFVCFD